MEKLVSRFLFSMALGLSVVTIEVCASGTGNSAGTQEKKQDPAPGTASANQNPGKKDATTQTQLTPEQEFAKKQSIREAYAKREAEDAKAGLDAISASREMIISQFCDAKVQSQKIKISNALCEGRSPSSFGCGGEPGGRRHSNFVIVPMNYKETCVKELKELMTKESKGLLDPYDYKKLQPPSPTYDPATGQFKMEERKEEEIKVPDVKAALVDGTASPEEFQEYVAKRYAGKLAEAKTFSDGIKSKYLILMDSDGVRQEYEKLEGELKTLQAVVADAVSNYVASEGAKKIIADLKAEAAKVPAAATAAKAQLGKIAPFATALNESDLIGYMQSLKAFSDQISTIQPKDPKNADKDPITALKAACSAVQALWATYQKGQADAPAAAQKNVDSKKEEIENILKRKLDLQKQQKEAEEKIKRKSDADLAVTNIGQIKHNIQTTLGEVQAQATQTQQQ